jgi:hypothetical protein
MKLRKAVLSFAILLSTLLAATGCRSHVIKVSLTNTSAQPVSMIEVNYPGASFGVNTLAPGQSFQYVIKPVEDGILKTQFSDAKGTTHKTYGPAVKKGQEGSIEIRLTQDSALTTPR